MNLRQDVVDMLRAGATYEEIKRKCRVSSNAIIKTRRAVGIQPPPGRAKRSRAELAVIEDQAVAMLRSGATSRQVRAETNLGPNRITALRKQHKIPTPTRSGGPRGRSVDEVFALCTRPTGDGHMVWTGPRSGRALDLNAAGRTHNARVVAFRQHHGRDPEGPVKTGCGMSGCVAGGHLEDRRIREQNRRADAVLASILGEAS